MPRKIYNGLDLLNQKIINLGSPVQPGDAASKAYVDNQIDTPGWKRPVRAASTAPINIGLPGATIDGVTLAVGDRVLLKDQLIAAQNGIYIWNGADALMTRADDANNPESLIPSSTMMVEQGTAHADTCWVLTSNGPIVIDTTALHFKRLDGEPYTAGPGISIDDRVISVDADAIIGRHTEVIGDGETTEIVVSHGIGSRNVLVRVRDTQTDEVVWPDIHHSSDDEITVVFGQAPDEGAYEVLVIG